MAPVEMVGMLREMRSVAWFSSPDMGIFSMFVLLVLSITLLALCLKCRRSPGNAYDVSGATTDGAGAGEGAANGAAGKVPTDTGSVNYTHWRNHKDMPSSTLERATTEVN